MFSSFTNYLWGGAEEAAANSESTTGGEPPLTPDCDENPVVLPKPLGGGSAPAASEDDWVVVGHQPAPGSLAGNLSPLVLSNDSSPASSSASSTSGDAAEWTEDPNAAAASPAAPVRGVHHQQAVVATQQRNIAKLTKAAQAGKAKQTSKALTAKSLRRANATAMSQYKSGGAHQKKMISRNNLAFKMAGANKNLKQC